MYPLHDLKASITRLEVLKKATGPSRLPFAIPYGKLPFVELKNKNISTESEASVITAIAKAALQK